MGEEFATSACRLSQRAGRSKLQGRLVKVGATDLPSLSAEKHDLLRQLLQAKNAARELSLSVWEFALDLQGLRAAGISDSEVRWAVVMGYVEHRAEVTRVGETERSFLAISNLQLTDKSCFILTSAGEEFFTDRSFARTATVLAVSADREACRLPAAGMSQAPQWDPQRRILRVGEMIVKEFKVPASNQELILVTFEELCWPASIDDPLPPRDGLDRKRRLHDTINSLNRNQRYPLLKFRGKGDGQGVCWEFHQIATRSRVAP